MCKWAEKIQIQADHSDDNTHQDKKRFINIAKLLNIIQREALLFIATSIPGLKTGIGHHYLKQPHYRCWAIYNKTFKDDYKND